MAAKMFFIDIETGIKDRKIHDIGALRDDGAVFHSNNINAFRDFLSGAEYLCGHNIVHHDLKFLAPLLEGFVHAVPVDTLYLSPLLFPKRPYHKLLKDDKLQTEELNNPVNDSRKARELLEDEITAFHALPDKLKEIFYRLLHEEEEFAGFFAYLDYNPDRRGFMGLLRRHSNYGASVVASLIREQFQGKICENADIENMVYQEPVSLAYALSLIHTGDPLSIVPAWIVKQYPQVYNLIELLCNRACEQRCSYCRERLDIFKALNRYFGYEKFRTFNGEPLQERAAQAAVDGKSLLAVFPTGGGKSITFQLPALMAGDNVHGLTVVISPLQSLMKDQVDNLAALGITGAVTVNGLLSPVERADAYHRVEDGSASLLYISPEMLRSRTIEKLLLGRNVVRFVVDEAHCFSAWGQDFRIDYQYIGDFIKRLQELKGSLERIPVSCFTATAKQKVISDIREYFKVKLGEDLELYATRAARENLHYTVLYQDDDEHKYLALRQLIQSRNCPAVVYVSRTGKSVEVAERLCKDGIEARPFNGRMESRDKIRNQEDFIGNKVQVIVATSAFGMGVDKKDIGLVVHYEISDSLENYVQESGRAGRDAALQAECFVLYNDSDLDKHFILLNQTKLSINEIQQVWKGLKYLTGNRDHVCCSALEIARAAGWDSSVRDIETRVRTAVAALENAGYVKRGQNIPHVYATGIKVQNMDEAVTRIENSKLMHGDQLKLQAKRIIKSLISCRSISKAGNEDAESRVDYLSDMLGIPKQEVISVVGMLRQERVLEDSSEMTAYIPKKSGLKKTLTRLSYLVRLERFLFTYIQNGDSEFNLKELNEKALASGIEKVSIMDIRTLLYFLVIKEYIKKEEFKGSSYVKTHPLMNPEEMGRHFERRVSLCQFIIEHFYSGSGDIQLEDNGENEIQASFSLLGILRAYRTGMLAMDVTQEDVQEALLYLSKIGAVRLEGGFLVLYNGMDIQRLEMDNHINYKLKDYAELQEFYKQRIQQIHIVGTFANMMVKDYAAALQFVDDYFNLEYKLFIKKYYQGSKVEELNLNMTHKRYQELFGVLSPQQKQIIDDNEAHHIVVVAGPGSGKTRVLVHKLAAVVTLEDVKHEQMLMLTFSRAAATEFKTRLVGLIGNAAHFMEIKTFHSYCFDLLGKMGNLEEVQNVVKNAAEMIRNGEVEPERIAKQVLVIDEAQDMNEEEYALVQALIDANEGMRVIAVGDDDQNIYEFRGSQSKYMRALITDYDARMYELVDNYRSRQQIVDFSNRFAHTLKNRLKDKDIVAVSTEPGSVELVEHVETHLEEPVVQNLLTDSLKGTSCLMTHTNDEALCLLGLLCNKDVKAKLIQSNDSFSLFNLVEVRFFLKQLGDENKISAETWKSAIGKLEEQYKRSTFLPDCIEMFSVFRKINRDLYRSDLDEFIRESHLEDFYKDERETVYVSTIHKTKGREFDHVYMMLNQKQIATEEQRRVLYVGMTRSRSTLHIHCLKGLFNGTEAPYVQQHPDGKEYPYPQEIALQLTHRDVVLSFSTPIKREILKHLQCGDDLQLCPGGATAYIGDRIKQVVMFSKAFNAKLQHLYDLGYALSSAKVRFIVAWKGEDDKTETAVVLPEIFLRRQ